MGKIHQCSICSYKSYFSGNFNRHMKKHEKDDISKSILSETNHKSLNDQSEYESSISDKSENASTYQQSEKHSHVSGEFLKRSYLSSDSEPDGIVPSDKRKVYKKKKN